MLSLETNLCFCMKYLATLAFILFLYVPAKAQFGSNPLEAELRSFNDAHPDQLPASYFMDSSFYKPYGLNRVKTTSRRLILLEASVTMAHDVFMVMQSMWKFDSKKQLDSFTTRFRPAFTLNGIRVNAPDAVPGVKMIALYKDGKDFKQWNDSRKQPAAGFYNFVFAVGNVVVNVYVQTRAGVPLEIAAIFAREAAERVRSAVGKK